MIIEVVFNAVVIVDARGAVVVVVVVVVFVANNDAIYSVENVFFCVCVHQT